MANKLRTIGTGIVVALVLAGTLTVWTYLARQVVDEQAFASLEAAFEALDAGRYEEAALLIRQLQDKKQLAPQDYGGPMFILGAIRAKEAEENTSPQQRRAAYLIAAGYLKQARARGFPAGRADEGIYLLAKSLANSAQSTESIPVLKEALEINPQWSTEIHGLLADAYLDLPTPELESALQHNQTHLEDQLLSPTQKEEHLLQQGEILLRLGKQAEAWKVYQTLPETAQRHADANILEGQLLMSDARAILIDSTLPNADRYARANQKFEEAIEVLRKAQMKDAQNKRRLPESMYLIGVCYAEMGPKYSDAALDQFARTRKQYMTLPEGIAASVAEADLLQSQKKYDDCVAAYRRTLFAVGDPSVYQNRWLPLSRLQTRIRNAHQGLMDAGQFDLASAMLDDFHPLFSQTEVLSIRAQSLKLNCVSKLTTQQATDRLEVKDRQQKARAYLRQAGQVFEQLAKHHFTTPSYTDILWEAADCYIQGQSYTQAARVLREYLKYEITARRPQALVLLGQALLAQGRYDECISALQECITLHHHDVAVYEARIICSHALREKGEMDQAIQMLLDNFSDDTLTPKSREWQDSLFYYGTLLHETGRYEEAINRLTEAVDRNVSQTILAHYLVADAYRQAAKEPLKRYEEAQSDNEREKQLESFHHYLNAAANHYQEVQQALTVASAEGDLNPLDQAILRNSYILRGGVLFDLRQYDAALEVFRNASSLYPNDPIVLETYVQIANCHRRMNRLVEARGALEQAKVVLRRIPSNADFSLATNLSRSEWNELLDEMSQW
ncbi:MAG: tetratricopeptide repeat protein [Pirellulales bacterium]|nr:tetratricopeptide repeat protein [Pirellulales bacterium]